MRAAILLSPKDAPPEFPVPTRPEALRSHLVERTGRLVPIVAHLPFEQIISDSLDLGADAEDSTLVLWVGPHLVLGEEEATTLDLDDHFEMAEQYVDEEVEQGMAEAYEKADHHDVDGARRNYVEVDKLLGQEDSPRHALVLVSLGELERQAGRLREASALLDRALAIAPGHIGALRGRAALAEQVGESAIAAAMHFRLVSQLDSDEQRLGTLSMVASESLSAAKNAIVRALEIKPDDRGLLERLRAIHEGSGHWSEAVSIGVQIAEGITVPKERALSLVQTARMASERAGNTQLAVALYEAAIEDDASVAGAFEAVEAELLRTEDFAGVAKAYERQLQRLAPTDAVSVRADLLRRLTRVQRDQLNDPRAAISALDRLVLEQPRDANAKVELAELLRETNQLALATRVLQAAADLAPTRAETYRSLLSLFEQLSDEDRAFNASSVLVALGEADINEQLRYAQYAPESLLGIKGAVDDDVWEQLKPPTHPAGVHALMEAIERAALEAWFADNEVKAQSIMPPPATQQDPKKTTVAAVKTFGWVARVLGISEPTIHAMPGAATLTAATLPKRRPALALGRQALSGRSLPELAFMAAHHLSFFRPAVRVLPFYPDLGEVTGLVWAAAALCRPELDGTLDDPTRALRDKLEAHLDAESRAAATAAVDRVLADDGKLDVLAWLRSVETVACRAALLVSGDVTVASSVLAVAGAAPGGRSARDRAEELLPFAVSQTYTALRHLLGVSVG